MHQLFEAQETLTLAMVGAVLLCASGPGRRTGQKQQRPLRRGGLRGRQPSKHREVMSPGGSLVRPDRTSMTWSPSTQDEARSQRVKLPWTPDSTVSKTPPPGEPFSKERRGFASHGREPVITDVWDPGEEASLVPKDSATLERLLHSAHAHCDLLHSLQQFNGSRALAKLLHKLSAHHELPLLDSDKERRFGAARPSQPLPPSETENHLGPGGCGNMADGSKTNQVVEDQAGRLPPVSCAVCGLRVRTLYAPCWSCGHGFHVSCFRRWFNSSDLGQNCPAIGCDCCCLQHVPLPGFHRHEGMA